ncbi:protocadherin-like wing polarity protein stan [Trichonephila clavipes]|nr:protocadherin-like wing polarity protein stan [Trichonephila clavipes]
MSVEVHFLHSHLDYFPENLGAVSEEQGERFHQDIKEMERRYQGRWNVNMMADYCGMLKRENSQEHSRKSVQISKHFMGDGFIVFIPHLHPIQLPWVQRVSFRTHHDHGLLLQIKLGHNSLIIVDIVDGYIRYLFNNQDLVLSDVTVNDGKWHTAEATWFPNGMLLSLDYGQYAVKKVIKANIRGMYIGKVSVGGVENPDDEGKIAFFIGCIQDVQIGTSQGTWLRPMVEVNVRDGCFSPNQCTSNPCPSNSKCMDHWGNYSCKCLDGHFGKQCLSVCELNPCSESSTCETVAPNIIIPTSKKSYNCKCDAQHTGEYCETRLDLPCPSNWWGYPICGPCQCNINKGYRVAKGPLTAKNLRLMVTKFEETGSLNVRSGREKKPVSTEAIEKVALQVEEDKSSNVLASTSVRRVAEALDLPRSTVQKIMRNILRYYPYKLQFVLPHDFETRHLFSLQFLARLEVDPEWP